MDGLTDWLVLNRFASDNLEAFTGLLKHFGEPGKIFDADLTAFRPIEGVKKQTWQRIRKCLAGYRESSLREMDEIAAGRLSVVTMSDPAYPLLLREIHDPPFVLYYRGDVSLLNSSRFLAVVGSRFASAYGLAAARKISSELARNGMGIVSGLARGIDTESHRGALESGITAAVLGNGIDRSYPPENRGLMDRIAEAGVVLTEYPPGTPPDRYNFPRRNRIISGLSYGVIVVEAAKRSGSLITANFALEHGREVFAVPGEISAVTSEGTNNLIKQGARLVETHLDILDALAFGALEPAHVRAGTDAGGHPAQPRAAVNKETKWSGPEGLLLSVTERKILDFMGQAKKSVDSIITGVDAPQKEVESALLMLELKDMIRQEFGKKFIRKDQ
jgi:DNA processing protein